MQERKLSTGTPWVLLCVLWLFLCDLCGFPGRSKHHCSSKSDGELMRTMPQFSSNPHTIHSWRVEFSAVPQYWQLTSSVSPIAPPQLGHWC